MPLRLSHTIIHWSRYARDSKTASAYEARILKYAVFPQLDANRLVAPKDLKGAVSLMITREPDARLLSKLKTLMIIPIVSVLINTTH